MSWRWPWCRRPSAPADGQLARAEAARQLRAAKNLTPLVERLAGELADLSPDEFAARVARAFGRDR